MFNDDRNDIKRNWFIAIGVFIVIIFLAVVIYPISIILTTGEWTELLEKKYEHVIEVLKIAGLFVGGIAVFINAFFAARRAYAMEESAKAANEKQITERFAKAIEQLASEKIEVRLGAIYTLERIAKDSAKDQWTIMEVLTAFVRENAPIKKEEKPQNKKPLVDEWLNVQKEKEIKELPKLRLDIQECLTVIGRREHPDPPGEILDLSNVNIIQANLAEANLIEANFTGSVLMGALLFEADLTKAFLFEANLIVANLKRANLTGADFSAANLTRANLKEANLTEALFCGANLTEAFLVGVNLTGADFSAAYLTRANLKVANLTKVNFIKADLTRVNLTRANLEGANLEYANLEYANLEGANLEGANLKGAIMPDGSIHD